MDTARRTAHSLLSSGNGSEKARGIVTLLKDKGAQQRFPGVNVRQYLRTVAKR